MMRPDIFGFPRVIPFRPSPGHSGWPKGKNGTGGGVSGGGYGGSSSSAWWKYKKILFLFVILLNLFDIFYIILLKNIIKHKKFIFFDIFIVPIKIKLIIITFFSYIF